MHVILQDSTIGLDVRHVLERSVLAASCLLMEA